jgi:CDP-diglyceride synthetase
MLFKEKNPIENYGEKIGFIFGYFLFTTVLFFILNFLNKIPKNWSYLNLMTLTFVIALIGTLIKRYFQ